MDAPEIIANSILRNEAASRGITQEELEEIIKDQMKYDPEWRN